MAYPMPEHPAGGSEGDVKFAENTLSGFRTARSLLSSAVDQIRTEWDRLVADIHNLLVRLEHELNNDSIWATISEWWTEKIRDAIGKVNHFIQIIGTQISDLLASLGKLVDSSMPVLSLFEVALDWATKVNTPLSDLSNDLTGQGAIDSWRGPAKVTYEKRVLDQTAAVEATSDKVRAVSDWLADVAEANTGYMAEMAARGADVVGLLVAMVIDGTETASGAVTQIVITLQHASELLGGIVQQTLEYLVNLAARMSEVVKQITAIAGEFGDHKGLPGGRWPAPVNA